MKPYGRRNVFQKSRRLPHGTGCSICYPDNITKARARRENKQAVEQAVSEHNDEPKAGALMSRCKCTKFYGWDFTAGEHWKGYGKKLHGPECPLRPKQLAVDARPSGHER